MTSYYHVKCSSFIALQYQHFQHNAPGHTDATFDVLITNGCECKRPI